MVVLGNVITLQGLEPLQFPTKFRSPSDSLVSDRPYRKAMSPFEAREILVKGAGKEFDPKIIEAFMAACRRGEMEVPAVVV